MTYQVDNFINGQCVSHKNGESHDVFNPALGKVAGQVIFATSKDIDQAVASAKQAFPAWANTSPAKRAQVMFKFKQLLEQHADELAKLVTAEHGKTLDDARGSVGRGLEVVDFACGIPSLLQGTYSENVASDIDTYTMRQPLGVCVGITPFNFPVMIPIWMFVQAIACGNTFILKPSEKDPSAPLMLAKLMKQAGLPDGVLNVVHGSKNVVEQLLQHPDVKAVSCVGSTPVAEHIYQMAIANGKRAQSFGGAKNHGIVMPDANIEQAAKAISAAAYGAAGERCMALSVAVAVGDQVADQLVAAIKKQIEQLHIGAGTEKGVDMGPLVTQEHYQRVQKYIDVGLKEGAKLLVDGRNVKPKNHPSGFFMGASLFDQVTPKMRIYQEEIFGPVLSVVRAKDFDSALKMINEHPFGNGTAIFTQNGKSARTFANQVQVGMVGVNVPIPVPAAYHVFGGWKRSVFGDTSMHGSESVRFYTKSKTVVARW